MVDQLIDQLLVQLTAWAYIVLDDEGA